MVGRLQDATDKSDARLLLDQGKQQRDSILKINNQQIVDPEEFQKTTAQQLTDSAKDISGRATNPRVKALVDAGMVPIIAEGQTNLKYDFFNKQKDKNLANFAEEEKLLTDQAASQDPEKRLDAYKTYGQRIGELKQAGFMDETA